jgi:hypothetical protein
VRFFFYWRRGAQTTCDIFLGNISAQPGARRWKAASDCTPVDATASRCKSPPVRARFRLLRCSLMRAEEKSPAYWLWGGSQVRGSFVSGGGGRCRAQGGLYPRTPGPLRLHPNSVCCNSCAPLLCCLLICCAPTPGTAITAMRQSGKIVTLTVYRVVNTICLQPRRQYHLSAVASSIPSVCSRVVDLLRHTC